MPEPESELIKGRLAKLDRLRARGIDPYPPRYRRSHTSQQAMDLFASIDTPDAQEPRTEPVSVGGRVTIFRGMGKATFADLVDGSGRIQLLFRRNNLPETYDLLDDLDIGDWLGATGPVFRTRAGEVTVEVLEFTVLSKSIRPLPEKWHGLTDLESRYRQRYLDLISNEGSRGIAVLRSRLVKAIRRFMDERGFIEVETPTLVPVAAGANARPFATHHNALDQGLFLRIAHELYLKRLIVGGLEKVFEIGKVFRNEGIDLMHNPEFTMLESYEAFADYNDVMGMVEALVYELARDVLGSPVVKYGGHEIDFSPPWPRLDLCSQIGERSGIDILELTDIESLKTAMKSAGVDVSQQRSWGGLVDKLISTRVEPHLIQPSFLVDYPVEMSPLAKKRSDNPRLVERFEGFVAGGEICNAFTELNDPVDQRARFEEQEALRVQFEDEETDRLDEDYLVAMEHGMPPTGGLGIGIDRLVMLLSAQTSIREVVLFPQLRSR
ncbi:MAG: lysine--tRNA ligase [Chloroflexi bacterium]|nr:lysine--tRNA ligase [Chloroflexota bacterium]